MLKVGVVGLGWWGQVLVRAVQNRSERMRVIRGVSPPSDDVAAFGRAHDLHLGTSYEELLEDAEVDAVLLATPHSRHVKQIELAAQAGKHVFCEKPLALSVAEARRALEACDRAGVVLAVGHNMRFLPAARHMADLVRSGAIGVPMHVEGHYSGPSAYRRAPGSWRLDPHESPLGGMTGMGIHLGDIMTAMFGEVDRVWIQSTRHVIDADLDDTTCLVLHFRRGLTGSITTLTATADLWRLTALGSKGWVEMRGLHSVTKRTVDGKEESLDFPETDIERAELESFVDTVESGVPYPILAHELLANIAVLEAARQAALSDLPVTLRAGGIDGSAADRERAHTA